jgi:asparagine synthase (glutamine-hydrolysing)
MCGIAGKISFKRPVSEEEILRMTKKITHRGPDDEGIFVEGGVGLGSRRLSIIDLSYAGHMPMISEDGETIIVYNGEIYDYQKEREELVKDGVRFRSRSDTEVVLYLYKKYGIGCLERMCGMFGFAIYDKEKNIIFAARDRFGEKPFKYYWDGQYFIFASELKAILENAEVKREIDPQAIFDYLTYQYVPCPATGFKNIYKLPHSHYLILDLKSGKLTIERYWQLDYSEKLDLNEDEWKKKILQSLEEAVKIRMVSDVPLGVFLSGGLDSSTVVAMMAKNSIQPIKTFSIGFEEDKFDERKYARIVAEIFKTDHHEFIVKPNMIDDLPDLVAYYEEPYGDPSMLPTYYLAKLTRGFVTVALNGDSGDENFAGYIRYKELQYYLALKKIPRFTRKIGKAIFEFIKANIYSNSFINHVIRFIDSLDEDDMSKYLQYIGYFTDSEKRKMLKEDFLTKNILADSSRFLKAIYEPVRANRLDKITYTDFNSYLPDVLMVKVDIATMKVSLESRAPLLDHKFVEMTAKIPPNLKLKNGISKYILKKALADILPEEILHRRKKGFGIPAGAWLRGELKDYYRDKVIDNSIFIKQIFKEEYVDQIFKEGKGGNLWLLLCLELWYREYFE